MKQAGRWPDVDPQQVVLLDIEPPVATPEGPALAEADVKLTRYENTEVEIEVTTSRAGFVVLNDIWHPWWRAELDGVETEILKANVLFRAVQVPAGTHKVRFSFHPLEGALAEVRDLVSPEEADEDAAAAERAADRVGAPELPRPVLSGPSQAVRERCASDRRRRPRRGTLYPRRRPTESGCASAETCRHPRRG